MNLLRVSDVVDGEEVMNDGSGVGAGERSDRNNGSGNDEEFNTGCYRIIIIRNN